MKTAGRLRSGTNDEYRPGVELFTVFGIFVPNYIRGLGTVVFNKKK